MAKQPRKISAKDTLALGVLPEGLDEPVVDKPRVQICAVDDLTGQGKQPVTLEVLSAMVANHDPETMKPPVTLDHADHGPAYGWIKKLWLEGDRLFASLADVPQRLSSAIDRRRFLSKSIGYHLDWSGTGKPKLVHVSYLGAQLPAVAGMEIDPIVGLAFAPGYETLSIPAQPAEELSAAPPPAGAAMAGIVITRDSRCDEVLGHAHTCYLDAEGNGYTDRPAEWDGDHGGYKTESEGHQHAVNAWQVEPAADENGVMHAHNLYKPNMLSRKDTIMPTPEVTTPAPAPAVPAVNPEIEKLQRENAELKAANEKTMGLVQLMRADAFATAQAAKFDSVFAKAVSEGRALPKDRETKLALFMAYPAEEAPITLSRDGKPEEIGPRALFLRDIAEAPVVVTLSRVSDTAGPVRGSGDANPANEAGRALHAAAEKLSSESNGRITYADALVACAKSAK